MSSSRVNMNPFNSITSVIGVVLFFVVAYYVLKGAFFILGLITPALLIGAAILDFKVYPDYAKWIWKTLQNNPIMGILAVIGSVVALPVLSGFLFIKALFRRRLKKMGVNMDQGFPGQASNEPKEEDFVDFEIVEEEMNKPLELPQMDKPKPETRGGDYEGLFD